MTIGQLEQTFRRVSHLQHVSAILQWDEAVMMASAGGDERSRAMATLGAVVHEHLTAPEVTDWLASAEDASASGHLDPLQRANLREMKRTVQRGRALPGDLVEASSRARATGEVLNPKYFESHLRERYLGSGI
jgi:carboxypeptidase Taq